MFYHQHSVETWFCRRVRKFSGCLPWFTPCRRCHYVLPQGAELEAGFSRCLLCFGVQFDSHLWLARPQRSFSKSGRNAGQAIERHRHDTLHATFSCVNVRYNIGRERDRVSSLLRSQGQKKHHTVATATVSISCQVCLLLLNTIC